MATIAAEVREITPERRKQVKQQAQILGIVHYVMAGLIGLSGLFFLVHVVFGVLLIAGAPVFPTPPTAPGAGPPPNVVLGGMALGMGTIAIFIFESLAALTAFAGSSFMRLHNRTFLLIMSGLNCLNQPLGLVLGIFGFIFLFDQDVIAMFNEKRAELQQAR